MPFWNSCGPTFLDREAVIESYRKLAREAIAIDPRIERVILFGSIATGRATSRSDADILIVLREHPLDAAHRIPEYLDHFVRGPVPVDVVPLTSAEIDRRIAAGNRFLAGALRHGIELAGRPSPAIGS